MQYVYFTKSLKELDVKGVAAFCKEVGVDGVDLTVRPGYPVTPDNAATALPEAVKIFRDAGLVLGLVSAATDLNDPDGKTARPCSTPAPRSRRRPSRSAISPIRDPFDDALKDARDFGWPASPSWRSGARCASVYHTHSGANLGNNAAGLRLLLQDLDPHHVGAYVDTGHTAVNGGPIPHGVGHGAAVAVDAGHQGHAVGKDRQAGLAIPRRAGRRRHRALERSGAQA